MKEQKTPGRYGAAAAAAVVIHAALAWVSLTADVEERIPLMPDEVIELEPWVPPPPEPPEPVEAPEPVQEPEPEPVQEPEPEPVPVPEPEPVQDPEPEPVQDPEPEPVQDPEPVQEPEPAEEPAEPAAPAIQPDVVDPDPDDDDEEDRAPSLPAPGPRKEPGSLLGKVMGRGSDPFGTDLGSFEDALEFKADGPMSDKKRAEKVAKRFIQHELAADAVDKGLADDYFRELKVRMETSWRPRAKDLSDGGKGTERFGFMKGAASNPQGWGEMLKIYQEMAEQYGRGKDVRVNRDRLAKAREAFRSKKGAFRFSAIAEVILTQAADGKVLTIEFATPTGHDGIDEGIKDAIQTAVAVMPYKPPERLSFGHAFRSKWRMRATWRMIPPTALLSGNAWDISQQGVEVDVPFQVKLSTKVFLLSFDNKSRSVGDF